MGAFGEKTTLVFIPPPLARQAPAGLIFPINQLIITAVGPDRPGIVGELTGHLHSAGGNILDSRMVNLRGQFAIVLLIELGEEVAARIERDLPAFGKQIGLTLNVTTQTTAPKHVD